MTATCPICGKPVDTLRARHVKVRGIQVVAYCSAECLGQAEPSVPVKIPTAPDSGPVIEIRYEPASGVVTSAPDARTGPTPKVEPDIPKVNLVKLKKQEEKEKKDKSDRIAKVNPPKRKSEPKLAVVFKTAPEKKSEPKLEPAPKANEKITEPKPISDELPKGVDKKRLEVIEQTSTKGSGTSLASGLAARDGKGPRKRGRETIQRDNSNASQSEDWLDDEPANVGAVRAGTDLGDIAPPKSGSGKRVLITLLIVALLAGAGVIAYRMLQSGKSTSKPGSGSPTTGASGSGSGSGSALKPRVVGPGSDVDVAPPTKSEQVAKATAILHRYLTAKNSPKMQQLSAIALARIGDKPAIDWLAGALDTPNGRLAVAQALARVGDKRGLDALYAALSGTRDDRLEAASKLAELGDKRGADTLANYLEVSQNRFGSAAWLARIGDQRGIKVLEQMLADPKTSADDKARATIALGYTSQELTGDLHALLADTHFNIDAAEVLVLRHDEAARPVLEKQLGLTSLRVRAARALRQLTPDRDVSAYLQRLRTMLEAPENQRDTELIAIAEAVLALAGPAPRAERT